MKNSNASTQTIAMVGMFTAVLAVLSILQIPMPSGVPITLQTFAVACAASAWAADAVPSVSCYI